MALAQSTTFPTLSPPTFSTLTSLNPNIVTTPYIYPPTCDPHTLGTLCSASPSSKFLCINTLGSRWSSCQPQIPVLTTSGIWRVTSASAGVKYFAAVCPSGWWALDVGLQERGRSTWSTASCCKSGDGLGEDVWRLYRTADWEGEGEFGRVCVDVWMTMRVVEGEAMLGGMGYYPGWTISWMGSDGGRLSPRWPTLTSNMLIPTWTPGMEIREGEFDRPATATSSSGSPATTAGEQDGETEDEGEVIVVIGGKIPNKAWKGIVIGVILGFFALCLGIGCVCWGIGGCGKKMKERRERRRRGGVPPLGERVRNSFKMKQRKNAGEAGLPAGVLEPRLRDVRDDQGNLIGAAEMTEVQAIEKKRRWL